MGLKRMHYMDDFGNIYTEWELYEKSDEEKGLMHLRQINRSDNDYMDLYL